ncbi:hypothetical protein KJ693_03840 [bacterium]|nr:hypothetical protein [bacterium]
MKKGSLVTGCILVFTGILIRIVTPSSKTIRELMEMGIAEEGSQFILVGGVNTHQA